MTVSPFRSVQQDDARRAAFTVDSLTQWGVYGTEDDIDQAFSDGLDRCIAHLRNHPPSPTRAARLAELLTWSVERQFRMTPGGRLYLLAHPIPSPWRDAS